MIHCPIVRSNPDWHLQGEGELERLAASQWHFPNHFISSFITSESRSPLALQIPPVGLDALSEAERRRGDRQQQ